MEILVALKKQSEKGVFDRFFEQHRSPVDEIEFAPQKDARTALKRRPIDVTIFSTDDSPEDLELIEEMLPFVKQGILLVVGPTINAKFVLKIQNINVARYLDIEELELELPKLLVEQRNRHTGDSAGKIITTVGLSGGCGASTISVSCAVEAARKHDSVALLDFNLMHGDAAAMLDLRPDHSISDFCRNLSRMDETMFSQCLTPHPSGVSLLSAPIRYTSIEDVTVDGIEHLLTLARQRYKYAFVDVPIGFNSILSTTLMQSDMILCVMRQDFTSLRHASKCLGYFDDLGIAENRIAFVMSRVGQSGELGLKEVEEALKLKSCASIPEDPRSVNWATNHGDPIVSSRPHSPASRAIKRLLDRIESFTK